MTEVVVDFVEDPKPLVVVAVLAVIEVVVTGVVIDSREVTES